MPDLRLRVGGREYGGWKAARVTRGIEAIAGAFELSIFDRWGGQDVPWPIAEEEECQLLIDDEVVITGYVDRRGLAYSAADHSMSVGGRDRTGALVDCSAVLSKWEYLNVPLLTLVTALAKPFGIAVTMQKGLVQPRPVQKLTIDPGDSAFDAIDRACRMAAVLPVSDGQGGLLLTRAGTARATTALVEGENILNASIDFEGSGRYRRYLVTGQHQGSDEYAGVGPAAVMGSALDNGVKRSNRVLMVRAESGLDAGYATRRAQWEAKVRAGRAEAVSISVQGWQQGNGKLWPANALVPVRSPYLGIDGEMLITQVTHVIDGSGGTTTSLAIKRPDAFIPEPVVAEGGRWWELAGMTAGKAH